MGWRRDTRGVSSVVGAVLLFGFLVIGLSGYQAMVVPEQNAKVEFQHSQRVDDQLVGVRNAVTGAATTARTRSQRVALGTRYPVRLVAVNPPPPSGTLRTVPPDGAGVRVANARALDAETGDFWNGTNRTYATKFLTYRADYAEYRGAPTTVYEHTVLYQRFPNGATVTRTGQQLVEGRDVDLTLLRGSYQRAGSGTVAVDASSPTRSPRTVLVASAGDPVRISVPTRLPLATWEELLADERVANGGYVTSLSKSGGRLRVELAATDAAGDPVTYELALPVAAVGTDVPDPDATYLTDAPGTSATVERGATTELVVEARNRYNGPESGVTPNASATAGSATVAGPTDVEGRTIVEYTAPDAAGVETVTVEEDLDGDGSVEADERVTFSVAVTGAAGGGDATGPVVRNPAVDPDPVSRGAAVDLTARIDDRSRGGTDIVAAEWFRVPPGEDADAVDPGAGNANPMAVSDGQWDQPNETVERLDVSTTSWRVDGGTSQHTIVFRGKDANGNWGPEVTYTVRVRRDGPPGGGDPPDTPCAGGPPCEP
ncbi:MAG: hypothetical protein ABEJ61_06225 [Haloferacaceae archaeon]